MHIVFTGKWISLASAYGYDHNGNQVSGAGRTITYSSYDQPLLIAKSLTNSTEFKYGPDRARWERIDTKGTQKTITHYLGGDPGWGSFLQSAVLGGIATEITGGKFKNGAAGAAFMWAVSAGISKIGAGGTTDGNQTDASGTVNDPNGKEGYETFEAAQKELIRQKNPFEHKAKYEDSYLVSFFDKKGNLVEPEVFAADDWAGAVSHARKTGKLIVNGLYNSRSETMTIYRSATHESIKSYRSSLKINVRGEYTNLESAINVIAHEVHHYQHQMSPHNFAYDAGHHAVLAYRRYKNSQ